MNQRRDVFLLHLLVEWIPVLVAHRRGGVLTLARIRIDHDADEAKIVNATIDLLERVRHRGAITLREPGYAAETVRLVLARERNSIIIGFDEPMDDLVGLFRVHQSERPGR